VPRMVLKCEIAHISLNHVRVLIKLKSYPHFNNYINLFCGIKVIRIFVLQSGGCHPTEFFEISSKTRATIEFGQIYCLPLDYVISRPHRPKRLNPIHMVPTG
jgi:hypothetical protein